MIDTQDIVDSLEKRQALLSLIDAMIESTYKPSPGRRLKRGVVQSFLCGQMNMTRNSFLCQLINERMKLKGYKLIRVQGHQYYRDVSPIYSTD